VEGEEWCWVEWKANSLEKNRLPLECWPECSRVCWLAVLFHSVRFAALCRQPSDRLFGKKPPNRYSLFWYPHRSGSACFHPSSWKRSLCTSPDTIPRSQVQRQEFQLKQRDFAWFDSNSLEEKTPQGTGDCSVRQAHPILGRWSSPLILSGQGIGQQGWAICPWWVRYGERRIRTECEACLRLRRLQDLNPRG
jgi:hypothetical protein